MNAPAGINPPALGTAMEGGFFIGAILPIDGAYGLIRAPKTHDFAAVTWGPYKDAPGALSLVDGPANTRAMAEAGSKLAEKILGMTIGGFSDWYLAAIDELDVMYRSAKPDARENACYMRSGINLHAMPPTLPYTPTDPKQTEVEIFRAGGAEAFETDDGYWSSTQYAGASGCAWNQWFNDGGQDGWSKDGKCRACLVRRFKL